MRRFGYEDIRIWGLLLDFLHRYAVKLSFLIEWRWETKCPLPDELHKMWIMTKQIFHFLTFFIVVKRIFLGSFPFISTSRNWVLIRKSISFFTKENKGISDRNFLKRFCPSKRYLANWDPWYKKKCPSINLTG